MPEPRMVDPSASLPPPLPVHLPTTLTSWSPVASSAPRVLTDGRWELGTVVQTAMVRSCTTMVPHKLGLKDNYE